MITKATFIVGVFHASVFRFTSPSVMLPRLPALGARACHGLKHYRDFMQCRALQKSAMLCRNNGPPLRTPFATTQRLANPGSNKDPRPDEYELRVGYGELNAMHK